MGLDLSLDGQPAGTGDELLKVHELLLQRMDELRALADRLEREGKRIESRLGPVEATVRQQGEAQERVLREGLARLEKQWSATAARFQTLADELWRRPSDVTHTPSRIERLTVALAGALLGATLGVGATMYFRDAGAGVEPVVEQPSSAPAAKARPSLPSKPARPRTP